MKERQMRDETLMGCCFLSYDGRGLVESADHASAWNVRIASVEIFYAVSSQWIVD